MVSAFLSAARIQPVGVNGITQYTEQCSGGNLPPSSPGEGLAPYQIQPVWLNGITQYTNERFCVCRYKCKCTTAPALRPVGGRLPPLQWGYHIGGHTIHPHRLYIQRGGRLIAAPTGPSDVYRFVGTVPVSKHGGRHIAPIIVNCPLSIVNSPRPPWGRHSHP